MPRVDLVVETATSRSARARQLEAIFDVPPAQKSRREWHLDLPIDEQPWQVGLVVGPSGSGKTKLGTHLWPSAIGQSFSWKGRSVIDDFAKKFSVEEIAGVCQAVGFNTIPAWLRPYRVLSNGEQFRATLARHLLEGGDPVVIDEFTSVVDRQVAKIGSHAVQKFVRKTERRFVGLSCHYDIIDWLQPDWVLDLGGDQRFERRRLRRRPKIAVEISPVPYAAWAVFSPFHYLTASLNRAARCFGLFVEGRCAAFAGMLHRPHPCKRFAPVMGCSRLVTLPDFQGLGLAFVLIEQVAAWYAAVGRRTHTYPAALHPGV